jgi:hypothetical protein
MGGVMILMQQSLGLQAPPHTPKPESIFSTQPAGQV